MTTTLNLKEPTIDTIEFIIIGEYCLKNMHLVQKMQNLITTELKKCKK